MHSHPPQIPHESIPLPPCWRSAPADLAETRRIGSLTLQRERPGALLRLGATVENTSGRWDAFDRERANGPRWHRFPVPVGAEFRFTPALPPLSIVMRLRYPITVHSGEVALCYAAIPLWCKVTSIADGEETELADLPTRVVSRAWWGSYQEGEMCYSLPGSDLLGPQTEAPESTAICRLSVTCASRREPVSVKVLHLPSPEMSLYRTPQQWWSSDIKVELRTDGDQEDIAIEELPADAPEAVRFSLPRLGTTTNERLRRFVSTPLAFIR